MFIVFEGIDGSGKSTQAKLLYDYLKNKGLKVELTKEPTKGPIGFLIRKFFLNSKSYLSKIEAFLFGADSYLHMKSLIEPLLKKDYIVISDRYFYSSIAYQGAAGLSLDYLINMHKNDLVPDIVFFLDCSVNVALKRAKHRGGTASKYETLSFLSKVRKNYLAIAKKYKNIVLVRCNSIINVHKRIVSEVERLL